MKCLTCQSENNAGSKFCGNCGQRLPVQCSGCGHENPPGHKFCSECATPIGGATAGALGTSAGETQSFELRERAAERRQLTVMFCDLMGSTEMSTTLDPEDLRAVMSSYQAAASTVIEQYEGHIAQYLGDGLLVYFGFPAAHEDDAQRAIETALGIIRGVTKLKLNLQVALRVRIGIATGLVVVGETGGGDASIPSAAVGQTPNIAARLQSLAGPNQVIVSSTTRHLSRNAFEFRDMGLKSLKGVSEPVPVYEVLRARASASRFEAHSGSVLTQLIGRDEELQLILGRWTSAIEGDGQVVLLSGEAGIGKSRIPLGVLEHLKDVDHAVLRLQCSPFHQKSPLYPFIQLFQQRAGIEHDDSEVTRLDKLEAMLAAQGAVLPEELMLFAGMLSIPTRRFPPLALSPQRQREKTIDAAVEFIARLSREHPLLLVFEDAHWIDPTSLGLLDQLVPLVCELPLLLLVTYRPEFVPTWVAGGHILLLTITRLRRAQRADLVRSIVGDKTLPEAVLQQILDKTDGVPLFVEELTRAVLEGNLLTDCGDHYELSGPIAPLAIPATLQDSLMSRLDRLSPVKEVAQIGATIGRTFDFELIRAVSGLTGQVLTDSLARLVSSDLISVRGHPPDAEYTFKHALVQDTAYESLLRSKRQQLHGGIARAILRSSPHTVETQPELLAHHYTAAGEAASALPYWLNAARRALGQSALEECASHLHSGLALIGTLPESPERNQMEVELQATLGTALMMWRGYSFPDVAVAYERAKELGLGGGSVVPLFPVLWGLWCYYLVRGDFAPTLAAATESHALALASRDPDIPVPAITMKIVTHFYMGEFTQALQMRDELRKVYDPERHGPQVWVYNHDGMVVSQIYEAHFLWMLGYPDQAVQAEVRNNERARALGHPFQVSFVLSMGSSCYIYRREWAEHRVRVEEAIAIATELSFPFYVAHGRIHRGLNLVHTGDVEAGIQEIREGLAGWEATGSGLLIMWYRSMLAEALGQLGRFEEGHRELDLALELIERSQGRCHEAEVYRLRGELLLAAAGSQRPSAQDLEAAETAFAKSLQVARDQRARGWELRTASSLARLWHDQGRSQEAYDLLTPVLDWFKEGLATADVVEGRALQGRVQSGAALTQE